MFVTGALLFLSAVLLAALLIWRRWHFSYFQRIGIPGPKPNIIWGNLKEYHSMEIYKVMGKWLDQYGDIFGFYNGDAPFVVTRDINFIEYIFVRNFQNFVDRGLTMMTDQMHPQLKKSIMHVGGFPWKSIRTSVAYGLSTSKLKQMVPHLQEDADIFIKSLQRHADNGEEVHMLRKFEELSMDYVARGSFGIDERFQGKPDHPLMAIAKATLRGTMKGPFHMIAQCTTTFGLLMKPFYWVSLLLGEYTFENFNEQTAKVIQLRKSDPTARKADILQNLLDAEYTEAEEERGDNKVSTGSIRSRALTTEEIITTATVLFIAGFETTATALSYIMYALAKHPEVQGKLRREVFDAVGTNGSLDYETVMKKLKYLEKVVDESLRLYPPGLSFVTRQAKEDFEYNGIKFKAGTSFIVPQYQILTDPRYFSNPMEFNPDRSSPGNEASFTKAAHIPFGVGPRNCVGMKLALLKLRYTVARMVQKYQVELGPSQKGAMELGQYGMVSTPSNGPWIVLRTLPNERSGS
ncbi:cytochrome P450 3A14-like isoform X2 [Dermacentor variabilis]|uniref:cytochrome P450 3A14-like isoform X2 n=1 Tax=Dermacentor variabilis TaxID=34621 RepID=UPI003F5B1FD0